MGYEVGLVKLGKKLLEQGATLDQVRTQVEGLKNLSNKTFEKWAEEVRENMPKVDDMMAMINRQFDRLDAISVERRRLDEEASKITVFLKKLNIVQRPPIDGVAGAEVATTHAA